VRRRALVVIASDKGLCGSFNMNVIRAAERMMEEGGLPLDTHYYTECERLETGEVNRTYDVNSAEKEGE
jgi:hypothetical protein